MTGRDEVEPAPPDGTAIVRTTHALSHGQEALWFLDRLVPGSAAYIAAMAARIAGKLDVAALRRAFEAVVQRHEALRMRFEEGDEGPVQRIFPLADLPPDWFREVQDESSTGQGLAGRVAATALRPFDLGKDPLLRVVVIGLGPADHLLVISAHHIVIDLWSYALLWSEVSSLYAAGSHPRPEPLAALPPPPLRYVDAAQRQRQQLAGPEGERDLTYWCKRLAGSPPHLDLPTDYPRPRRFTHQGAFATVRMPAAVGAQLMQAAQGSLFTSLLSCWSILLARYSAQLLATLGN
jgi:hypothetical protein